MHLLARWLQPRFPALAVTAGPVDVGRHAWLTEDRLVVGSAPGADLHLEGPGILPQHLVLTRQRAPGGFRSWLAAQPDRWVFSLQGDPLNRLNGAPAPRSGPLDGASTIGLGGLTELRLEQRPVTAAAPAPVQAAVRRLRVPMDDYWAYAAVLYTLALAAMVGLYLFVFATLNRPAPPPERNLWIDTWFTGAPETGAAAQQGAAMRTDFAQSLAACARPVPAAEAFDLVLEAHLRQAQNDRDGAAAILARLDGMFARAGCPALSALRCDRVQIQFPRDPAKHCAPETSP